MKKDDEILLDEIRDCLDTMDREIRVDTPDLDKIRKLVDQVEDKKKKKNDLQFLTFIILGAFAVSFEAFIFSRLSLNLVGISQAAILVCIPVAFEIGKRIKRRKVNGI
jgi:hypothetical protein